MQSFCDLDPDKMGSVRFGQHKYLRGRWPSSLLDDRGPRSGMYVSAEDDEALQMVKLSVSFADQGLQLFTTPTPGWLR